MMKRGYTVGAAFLLMGIVGCTDASERTVGYRDENVTAKVEASLRDKIPGQQIEVATRDRVVTLSGTVPDAATRDRAGQIAAATDGVERVNNNLRATIAGDAPAGNRPANPPPAPEMR